MTTTKWIENKMRRSYENHQIIQVSIWEPPIVSTIEDKKCFKKTHPHNVWIWFGSCGISRNSKPHASCFLLYENEIFKRYFFE